MIIKYTHWQWWNELEYFLDNDKQFQSKKNLLDQKFFTGIENIPIGLLEEV